MEQMQFAAVVLLTLLLAKLLMLPVKVALNPVASKSRWLMVAGIACLDLQFLLQYALGLRALGVTQAVLLNLVLFIPSSWTISLAIINLQRQGGITRLDKLVGGVTWAFALCLLGIAAVIDGRPLLSDSPQLHNAEVVTSVFYMTMQGHYAWQHTVNLRRMRLALQNYYDHDMDDMLVWMKFSIIVLMVLALMVPLLIFVQSGGLAVFGLLFFGGIFYLVDTFCNYVVSSAQRKMQDAEKGERTSGGEGVCGGEKLHGSCSSESWASEGAEEYVAAMEWTSEGQIQKWIGEGGYLRNGITMPTAAEEIGIPRSHLTAWLKRHKLTYAAWITNLRIEEAKRLMEAHPGWTNEAVAQHCGFTDRTYFQKKFKEKTGVSPSDYHP